MLSASPQAEKTRESRERLKEFVRKSRFFERGAVVTDLDGTAVHEDQGKIVIPQSVERALAQLAGLGRPIILNTLRFPLSVLRTFGRDWYCISRAPLPTVTLNGSLLGNIVELPGGELAYEEVAAFPLEPQEIDAALKPVELLLEDGIDDVLVFYYPRDWRIGEVIWTPRPEKILPVKDKYVSASSVTAVDFEKLRAELHREPICMIFLLIDVPADHKMAYQHTKGSHFFTHAGVDKLSGAREMALRLGVDLSESVGAGDAETDRFLQGVGCSVIVGGLDVPYRGLALNLRVPHSHALGDLLAELVALQRDHGA
jgi:hydroxymethylpyrimidine pyrophosphatase-like HAD family hydrolase